MPYQKNICISIAGWLRQCIFLPLVWTKWLNTLQESFVFISYHGNLLMWEQWVFQNWRRLKKKKKESKEKEVQLLPSIVTGNTMLADRQKLQCRQSGSTNKRVQCLFTTHAAIPRCALDAEVGYGSFCLGHKRAMFTFELEVSPPSFRLLPNRHKTAVSLRFSVMFFVFACQLY